MDPLSLHDYSTRLSIVDQFRKAPLPEWAAALIWMGAWCRTRQLHGRRLVTIAVLPTRELAAAFAGVGALAAGANLFEPAITWPRFRALPSGTVVHWRPRNGSSRSSGTVEGFQIYGDSEFISVKVTFPHAQAKKGIVLSVSERFFGDYLFSEETPPSQTKAKAFGRTAALIGALLGETTTQWVWADGAEALVVTRMSRFEQELGALALAAGTTEGIPIHDLLCASRNGETTHAKIRVTHPAGDIGGEFPLIVLDGPEAFFTHEHLPQQPNLLIILSRAEYQEGIHNIVLQLRAHAAEFTKDEVSGIPVRFPHGVECAAFAVAHQ